MTRSIDVVVIGAGPYGLATGAHLHAAGVEAKVFGEPLQFWRTQTPKGMLLRSPRRGSDIGGPSSRFRLRDFARDRGREIPAPVPVETFLDYGDWFCGQAVPTLDRRTVRDVERTDRGFRVAVDDEIIEARRVVVAAGVGTFAWSPPQFVALGDGATHTLDHHDLTEFGSQRVCVVGGGQSSLESAALLRELGADVEVLVRAPSVRWLTESSWRHTTWPVNRVLFAAPDVGPAVKSHLVAHPGLFRRLPRDEQERLAVRSVGPAGAGWLRSRLTDVPITTGTEVRTAVRQGPRIRLDLSTGETRDVAHVLLGTGYRVDLARYAFLPASIRDQIDCVGGYPKLSSAFETTVPGLHVIGAPAAWSFGPLMRFVAGSAFAARTLTNGIRT